MNARASHPVIARSEATWQSMPFQPPSSGKRHGLPRRREDRLLAMTGCGRFDLRWPGFLTKKASCPRNVRRQWSVSGAGHFSQSRPCRKNSRRVRGTAARGKARATARDFSKNAPPRKHSTAGHHAHASRARPIIPLRSSPPGRIPAFPRYPPSPWPRRPRPARSHTSARLFPGPGTTSAP